MVIKFLFYTGFTLLLCSFYMKGLLQNLDNLDYYDKGVLDIHTIFCLNMAFCNSSAFFLINTAALLEISLCPILFSLTRLICHN